MADAAKAAAKEHTEIAGEHADEAEESAAAAWAGAAAAEKQAVQSQSAAARAETARDAVENMTVSADTLPPGSEAAAVKTTAGGSFHIHFGIPAGAQGATGPQGPQGIQGPEGPRGVSGAAVAADGHYAFGIDDEGHLILHHTGSEAPRFYIDGTDGHLKLTIT